MSSETGTPENMEPGTTVEKQLKPCLVQVVWPDPHPAPAHPLAALPSPRAAHTFSPAPLPSPHHADHPYHRTTYPHVLPAQHSPLPFPPSPILLTRAALFSVHSSPLSPAAFTFLHPSPAFHIASPSAACEVPYFMDLISDSLDCFLAEALGLPKLFRSPTHSSKGSREEEEQKI